MTLDDADHLLSREDAEYAAEVIAAWAGRYLPLRAPAPPPGAPEGVVRVSEADPDGFLQDIDAGPRHHAVADEPAGLWRHRPGPVALWLPCRGAWRLHLDDDPMYARKKGWPLSHVSVEVTHDKMHAQDAATGIVPRIDRFHRAIRLEGDLSEEQRERLRRDRRQVPGTSDARDRRRGRDGAYRRAGTGLSPPLRRILHSGASPGRCRPSSPA